MKSKIVITNIKNINFDENKVIDNSKVEEKIYDSDMDIFTFENIKTGTQWKGNLMHVSLFDDVILDNDEKFKILHMLSKSDFQAVSQLPMINNRFNVVYHLLGLVKLLFYK